MYIEFCIKINYFQPLYDAVSMLSSENLYKYLNDYILNKQFIEVDINLNFLKCYIKNFLEQHDKILLCKILMFLKVEILCNKEIIKLLEDNELFNPYIYAKINENGLKNDFFQPVESLLSFFKNYDKSKLNDEISKEYFNLITSHDMNFYNDNTLTCHDYIGHKIFLYCNYCFKNKLNKEYPRVAKFTKELFEETNKKIIFYLTLDEVMEILLNFDSFSYFEIIKNFFTQNNLYKLIEKNCEPNEQNFPFKDLDKFVESYSNNISIESLNGEYFYYQIKKFVDKLEINDDNYYNFFIKYDFYLMTALICSKKIKNLLIDKPTLIDAIKFFINFDYEKINIEKDKFKCHVLPENEVKHKEYLNTIEKNISDLIQYLYSNNVVDEKDIDELLSLPGINKYINIKINLYNHARKFEEIFELKIQEFNKLNPEINKETNIKNLFKWVNVILKDTYINKNKKDVEQNDFNKKDFHNIFKEFLKQKFEILGKISIKELSKILKIWYNDEQENIIFSMDNEISEIMKYNYIDKYLKDQDKMGDEKDEKYEKFYLKKIDLLIKNNQKEQIIKVLQKTRFLWNKDMLDLLTLNKVNDGVIFIYQKLEDLDNCLNLSIIEIDNLFNEIKFLLESDRKKYNDGLINAKLDEIKRYLELVLNLCLITTDFNTVTKDDIKNSWLKLLTKIYDLRINLKKASNNSKKSSDETTNNNFEIIKKKSYEKVSQSLYENIELILGKMNDCIPLKMILDILYEKFNKATSKDYCKIFQGLFYDCHQTEEILKCISNIIYFSASTGYENLLNESQKGFFTLLEKCDFCGKPIVENYKFNNFRYFKCGHLYHNHCCAIVGKKFICYICTEKEREDSAFTIKMNYQKRESINKKLTEEEKEEDEKNKKKNQKKRCLMKLKRIRKKVRELDETFIIDEGFN